MFWFSWAKSNTGLFFEISPRRQTPTGADQCRYVPRSAERIILTGSRNPDESEKKNDLAGFAFAGIQTLP
jgi:hypothetical protein